MTLGVILQMSVNSRNTKLPFICKFHNIPTNVMYIACLRILSNISDIMLPQNHMRMRFGVGIFFHKKKFWFSLNHIITMPLTKPSHVLPPPLLPTHTTHTHTLTHPHLCVDHNGCQLFRANLHSVSSLVYSPHNRYTSYKNSFVLLLQLTIEQRGNPTLSSKTSSQQTHRNAILAYI